MRRIGTLLAGMVLAETFAAALPAAEAEAVKKLGNGQAYELIGKVAVMHEGRIKPLDTVAREEVKQVYGSRIAESFGASEAIKLRDPREEVEKILGTDHSSKSNGTEWSVEKWGPIGAFLGWTIYPEFWDDKPFILVDYLPLRRLIIADALAEQLKRIADKESTPAADKAELQKLVADKIASAPNLDRVSPEQQATGRRPSDDR